MVEPPCQSRGCQGQRHKDGREVWDRGRKRRSQPGRRGGGAVNAEHVAAIVDAKVVTVGEGEATGALVVAIATVEIHHAIPPGLGPLDWLDWFLYLPQVLYVIMFVWLMVTGPGPVSVDHLIARRLGLEREEGA